MKRSISTPKKNNSRKGRKGGKGGTWEDAYTVKSLLKEDLRRGELKKECEGEQQQLKLWE